jgi:hypothetical protein
MSTLPSDLTTAGMALYPNGIYINSGLPNPGVSFCFPTLERNIEAGRAYLAARATRLEHEAAQRLAEQAKAVAKKRPRRREAAPITPPPTAPAAPAWQRAAQLTLELTE